MLNVVTLLNPGGKKQPKRRRKSVVKKTKSRDKKKTSRKAASARSSSRRRKKNPFYSKSTGRKLTGAAVKSAKSLLKRVAEGEAAISELEEAGFVYQPEDRTTIRGPKLGSISRSERSTARLQTLRKEGGVATTKKKRKRKSTASRGSKKKSTRASRSRTTKKRTTRKKSATRKTSKRKTSKRKTAKRKTTASKRRHHLSRKKKPKSVGRRSKSRAKRYMASKRRAYRKGKRGPNLKRKVTLYAGYPMKKSKRRSLVKSGHLSKAGVVNPGGRKKHKRKKTMRKQKNPSFASVAQQVFSYPVMRDGSHFLLAGTVNCYLPETIARLANKAGITEDLNSGYVGVATQALSAVGGVFVANYLENTFRGGDSYFRNGARNFAIAGAAITIARAFRELAPQIADQLCIPEFPRPVVPGLGSFLNLSGMGSFLNLSGMEGMRGMGAMHHDQHLSGVTMPEQLIAGESFARQVNEFHGMGQAIPMQDILSPGQSVPVGMAPNYPGQYGGNAGTMGSFLETIPGAVPSLREGFAPALENF